jgi:hypothetical protein
MNKRCHLFSFFSERIHKNFLKLPAVSGSLGEKMAFRHCQISAGKKTFKKLQCQVHAHNWADSMHYETIKIQGVSFIEKKQSP